MSEKFYYKTPLIKNSTSTGQSLGKFNIYFVYKYDSFNKSWLLGRKDKLTGKSNQETNMLGWTVKYTVTPWSTRVCFEPVSAPSYNDVEFIQGEPGLIPGYEDKRHLITGLENRFYPNFLDTFNPDNSQTYIISFRAEKIPNDRMRMPLLNDKKTSIWTNPEEPSDQRTIYNVVSIAKDNSGLDENQKMIYEKKKDVLLKFQQDVNIIFAIDATGSMIDFKSKIAESLSRIDELNKFNQNANLSFGFIFYRDYKDGGPKSGKKLSINSQKSDREQVALEYLPLYPATKSNMKAFQSIINSTDFGSQFDTDIATNEPEALYNGLINGLSGIFKNDGSDQEKKYQEQSNVVVLIGDCGNYKDSDDINNYNKDQVSELFKKYNINLITFQVNNDGTPAYSKFYLQAMKVGTDVGEDWIKGKEGGNLQLRVKWKKEEENNSEKIYKLDFYSEANAKVNERSENFTPIFSKLVLAPKKTEFNPNQLKTLIEKSFSEYMEALSTNIKLLNDLINTNIGGQKPSPLLIAQLMELFNFSEEEALAWVRQQEITVEALVLENYLSDEKAVQRVAFLTGDELDELVNAIDVMIGKQYGSKKDDYVNKRKSFQRGLIKMVETIIGSTGVENLTMDDAWKVLFGAPFEMNQYKHLKTIKLSTLSTQKGKVKKDLDEFIEYFYEKSEDFIRKTKSYVVTNKYERRQFKIYGVQGTFYWVPLKDLPATSN